MNWSGFLSLCSFILLFILLSAVPVLAAPLRVVDTTSRQQFKIWGANCGAKPRFPPPERGEQYIRRAGGLLPLSGARPLLGPDFCEVSTRLPGLAGRGGGARWRCASPEGAAQAVKGEASLRSLDEGIILVRQKFSYRWTLKGTLCQLEQTLSWRLEGEVSRPVAPREVTPAVALPAPTAPPTPPKQRVEPPPSAHVAHCAGEPQPPLRLYSPQGRTLTLSPEQDWLRFKVWALDQRGCAVPVEVEWESPQGRIDGFGHLDLSDQLESEPFTVTARAPSSRWQWEVFPLQLALPMNQYGGDTEEAATLSEGRTLSGKQSESLVQDIHERPFLYLLIPLLLALPLFWWLLRKPSIRCEPSMDFPCPRCGYQYPYTLKHCLEPDSVDALEELES
ncbi:MAG: hypothetical protein VYD19_10950 [Myxococcota bacterium]|nr:hypothetical protein [Myxococcota bacterium]